LSSWLVYFILIKTLKKENFFYFCLDLNREEPLKDFIKCYSCDSSARARTIHRCKSSPKDSSLVIWCQAKRQKCFTKSVYNTTNRNQLISFSRGCGSVDDLTQISPTTGITTETTTIDDTNDDKTSQTTSTTKN
jgi:hypothetical protein